MGSLLARSVHNLLVPLVIASVYASSSSPDPLHGTYGASDASGSGWLDLHTPLDVQAGDELRLIIGGDAARILVRLLPRGADPTSSTGLLPGQFVVAADRTVRVIVPSERKSVVQVSVHGKAKPWSVNLGAANGTATLLGAEIVRRARAERGR